jgi:DNA polymerase-2
MAELTGWLLDVYPGRRDLTVWLLGDDGLRHRLRQPFPATFYAALPPEAGGRTAALRQAWTWLAAQPEALRLRRAERRDLFAGPTTVLEVEVRNPAEQPGLFRRLAQAFPGLVYYDADLQPALRYMAAFGAFPLARLRLQVERDCIRSLETLVTPWQLEAPLPPLRPLLLEPDCDPAHAEPRGLILTWDGCQVGLPLRDPEGLLRELARVLLGWDPDLLLTTWGDTWLLPRLFELCEHTGLPLPLNRDPQAAITRKEQRTYYAYGQVIYRGAQVHLAGRWHIDAGNTVMYHDYGMDGVFEMARVTGLPVQTAARVSPGTGISSMQIVTALRQGVLVPWRKQVAEAARTAADLVASDMGGLIYQPTVGLHAHVGEIDFTSMYPSIMDHFNISPETILPGERHPLNGLPRTRPERGLVPDTLAPLLGKRIALKSALLTLPESDPQRRAFQAAAAAHKWLLVTCFGYLGYKNARFGRIEAHEAVTAFGREILLMAKEAAEDLGFEVLHLYVDGMWVKKPGCTQVQDFQPILELILERTGLPLALDGVFRWVAFLPSRANKRVPVANRYFGVFQNGEVKARGIELRRHDTPIYIRDLQKEMLAHMAQAPDLPALLALQPELRARLRAAGDDLRRGRVPPEKLVVRHTLSRELERYRSPSPAAIAARQLAEAGKPLRPGQAVRFLYTLGKPGVHAWDLDEAIPPARLDVRRYLTLLERAAGTILEIFPVHPPPSLFPLPQREAVPVWF